MRRALLVLGLLGVGCTYEPPRRSADFYENPEPYADQSDTHPGRERFQAYLDAAVRDGLPGAVLLVRTPGLGTWVGAAGYADVANDVPWRPSMIGRVGSITKMFAAAVILKLFDEQALSLDARGGAWLSSDLRAEISNAKSASVSQLLHHTSGIYDYLSSTRLFFEAAGAYDFDYHSKEELLEYAYGKDAEYRPGEGWNYSETNFLLLESLAEKLSGSDSERLLRSLVVSELGLRSTFYAPGAPLPAGLVRGYSDLFGDQRLIDVTDTNLDRFHYDGGVISNVYDLADFLDALLAGDFLGDDARERLLEVVSTQGQSERGTDYYGCGLILEEHPKYGRVWGHSGTTMGFTAHVYQLEDSGVTFAAIVNASQKVLERRSYEWFSPLEHDGILELVNTTP